MTLTIVGPDVTDNPPIYIGPGFRVVAFSTTAFSSGDTAVFNLFYNGSSAEYPLATANTFLTAGGTFAIGDLVAIPVPTRGAALGQILHLRVELIHHPGGTYDSVVDTTNFAWDPVSRAGGDVRAVLAAVTRLYSNS